MLDFLPLNVLPSPNSHVPKSKVGRMAATEVEAEHAGPWAGFPPLPADLPGPSTFLPLLDGMPWELSVLRDLLSQVGR